MRIGIVLHPFGDSAKGLEQYIFETTHAIIQESHEVTDFIVFVKGNPDTSGLPKGITVVHLPDAFYWHIALLRWYTRCDTFIFFTEAAPLFLWKKSIIVFFDAAYYYFGKKSLFARAQRTFLVWWRSAMMQSAWHVVAISEASKRDLVEKFNVPSNQVTVIYPGFKTFEGLEQTHTSAPLKPFFMYVGPMKERKNVLRIVEAYIEFRRTSTYTHELYLVGRPTKGVYESTVLKCISESEYRDSIILKTDIDDTSLYTLYKTTTALVYPSLLEGFGLPILEALSVGCMVITSSTTSTKEVVGDAGFLVNPCSIEEIAEAMTRVGHDDYPRGEFIENATKQCTKFSWKKSGQGWHIIIQQNRMNCDKLSLAEVIKKKFNF